MLINSYHGHSRPLKGENAFYMTVYQTLVFFKMKSRYHRHFPLLKTPSLFMIFSHLARLYDPKFAINSVDIGGKFVLQYNVCNAGKMIQILDLHIIEIIQESYICM